MSKIEWTEQTWNPIVGCSIVSPGCTHCYAMTMAARIEAMGNQPRYAGTTRKVKGHAIWTGKLAQAPQETLLAPLRRKKPTTYFVNSMGDLFHEDCPDGWIDRVFAVMALCPRHTFQVLTKRAARMRSYFCAPHRASIASVITKFICEGIIKTDYDAARATAAIWHHEPLPNVWLGVSAERQQEADERIPLLLQTPAAVRFISAEPLLGPINLRNHEPHGTAHGWSSIWKDNAIGRPWLDWVIVGGESGPRARPMHPDWARSLRDQCAEEGIAFFFKQWGEWGPENWDDKQSTRAAWISPDGTALDDVIDIQQSNAKKPFSLIFRHGKKRAGRLLDGELHNAVPGRLKLMKQKMGAG